MVIHFLTPVLRYINPHVRKGTYVPTGTYGPVGKVYFIFIKRPYGPYVPIGTGHTGPIGPYGPDRRYGPVGAARKVRAYGPDRMYLLDQRVGRYIWAIGPYGP